MTGGGGYEDKEASKRVDLNCQKSRVPFGHGGFGDLFDQVDGHRRLDTGFWSPGPWSRADLSVNIVSIEVASKADIGQGHPEG